MHKFVHDVWAARPVTPQHEVVADPAGAAGTVLFSPADVEGADLWRPLAEALGDRWRTVLVDLAPQPPRSGPQGVGALAADLVQVAEALEADQVWHVGLGAGGAVGQELALEHPGLVRGLVLVASAAVLDEEALAALAPDDGDDVHVPAVVRTFDTRGWLELVRAPTLVVAGADDDASAYAAEVLAAGVPGARLVLLPGVAGAAATVAAGALEGLVREHLEAGG